MEHTTFLEDIEKIVYEKSNKTGIKYINLSDWNPSQEFIQKLAKKLPSNFAQNSISYIFSSDIDVSSVIVKLSENYMIIFIIT